MSLLLRIDESGKLSNWAIIEIQGELESRTASNLQSQFVGDLYFKNEEGNNTAAILIIGHHILYGKIQELDKPLAVIEKCQSMLPEGSSYKLKYNIKAIVTRKIAFRTRPKPIIADCN